MFHLENIKYILMLILPLAMGVSIVVYSKWKKEKRKEFVDEVLYDRVFIDKVKIFSRANVLLLIGCVFLVIGLINILGKTKEEVVLSNGKDVVFVLDLSKSMDAQDTPPSRLFKAKYIVSQVVDNLENTRLGAIGFAGSTISLSPLTNDKESLKSKINNVSTNLLEIQGTDIYQAIKTSIGMLIAVNTNKSLVLISDGEIHDKGLDKAIALAQEEGVVINTIGIGKTKGAPIPEEAGYKKDAKGETVLTKLEEESLKKLAQGTGGRYINGEIGNIQEIVHNINTNQQKPTKGLSQNREQYFQGFIFVGFILILISSYLGMKTKFND